MTRFPTRPRSLGVVAFAAVALVIGSAIPTFGASPRSARAAVEDQNPDGKFLGVVPSRPPATGAARPYDNSPLMYHNGPVQHSSAIYGILWKPSAFAVPAGYQAGIAQYFKGVAHDSYKISNVYSTSTQYYDVTASVKKFVSYSVVFRSLAVDSDAYPANGCPNYKLDDGSTSKRCLTSAQIEHELGVIIAAKHLPTGLGTEYFLFTPKSVASCFAANALSTGGCYDPQAFSGYCAYHSSFNVSSQVVLYANLAFAALPGCSTSQSPNGNAFDSVVNNISHESSETMTDPLGTGWYDINGDEMADKCYTTFGSPVGSNSSGAFNQVINAHDYWLQEEWSNRAASCVQRNTYPQPAASFTHTPVNPAHGTVVSFKSTVHETGNTTFTYHWTFPGGSASSVANPKFTFPAAGTFSVTLVVFDPHGDQVRVVRSVKVT